MCTNKEGKEWTPPALFRSFYSLPLNFRVFKKNVSEYLKKNDIDMRTHWYLRRTWEDKREHLLPLPQKATGCFAVLWYIQAWLVSGELSSPCIWNLSPSEVDSNRNQKWGCMHPGLDGLYLGFCPQKVIEVEKNDKDHFGEWTERWILGLSSLSSIFLTRTSSPFWPSTYV